MPSGAAASPGISGEWRLNIVLPETGPETAQVADEVQTARDGKDLKPEVHSGGSLGLRNTALLRALPRGTVEMSLLWSNDHGRAAPALRPVFVRARSGLC
ncbi:hypothetical protein PVT71_15355 [Salipiger sp. H15]|uniref:Uncharacterized protein n=1 Tax=Alloyangia sp. H15 TaxID=3029062 RepID=A0AAU8AM67_9RHOB